MGRLITQVVNSDIAHFTTNISNPLNSLKVYFSPIQNGSGDPTPDNIRQFAGWTGVNVKHAKKNIAHLVSYSAATISSPEAQPQTSNSYGTVINNTDPTMPLVVTQNNYSSEYEPVSTYNNGYFIIVDDNLEYGKKYNISFDVTNAVMPDSVGLTDLLAYGPYGGGTGAEIVTGTRVVFKNLTYNKHPQVTDRHGIEIRNCGMSFNVSNIMITPADDEDYNYVPYENETLYSIDWTDSGGTVYGGYVDLINGQLIQTHKKVTVSDLQWRTVTSMGEGAFATKSRTPDDMSRNTSVMSNSYKTISSYSSWSSYQNEDTNIISRYSPSDNLAIVIKDTRYETIDEFVQNQGNVEIIYELNNPIVYNLSQTNIQSFIGTNNIYANTADNIEVSYKKYKIDTNTNIIAKRNRILSNTPHTESVSGSIVNFSTDMAAPLKSAKIYFNPIQDLHGQAEAYYTTGKNLLNISESLKWGKESFTGSVVEYNTGIKIQDISVDGGYWVKVDPNTTYTYSFTSTYNGSNLHGRVWGFSEKQTTRSLPDSALLVNKHSWTGSETFTTFEDTEWLLVGVYAYNSGLNCTISNMQLEKGSEATEYEPFKGIFPITGYSGINLFSSGKNLLPAADYVKTSNGITFTYSSDGSIHIEGTSTSTSYLNVPTSMYFTVVPGIYTLSNNNSDSFTMYMVASKTNSRGDVGMRTFSTKNTATREICFTDTEFRLQIAVLADKTVNTTIYPQFEAGASATDFERPKSIIDNYVSFDSLDGTIYGGYIDYKNKKIVKEWIMKSAKWGDIKYSTYDENTGLCQGTIDFGEQIVNSVQKTSYGDSILCNCISTVKWELADELPAHLYSYGQYGRIFLPYDTDDNLEIQMAAKIATPVEYDISNQTISSIKGVNNFWSNGNNTSIEYWTH